MCRFRSSCVFCQCITKTCLYLNHFYIVKLGFTGVTFFLLFLLKNIDCGYSLELPHRGGSNEYPYNRLFQAVQASTHNLCFEQKFVFVRIFNATRQPRNIEAAAIVMYMYLYNLASMDHPCTRCHCLSLSAALSTLYSTVVMTVYKFYVLWHK